jgi:Flp pilus assembly protein TadB
MLAEMWVEEGAKRPSRNLRKLTPRNRSLRSQFRGDPESGGPRMSVLAGVAAAVAALLVVPARARLRTRPESGRTPGLPRGDWMHRWRWLWAGLAGVAAFVFVGGRAAPAAAAVAGVAAWWFIGRTESPAVRRIRRQVRSDLPHLVDLLAAALRGGATPGAGVRMACAALPGPAADRLGGVTERLELGVDPERVWSSLADDPDLAPLGRALARSHRTGAGVVSTIEQLADELGRSARAHVEERARAVGVRAALPLGLCLLPSFLLLGIVPLVVGMLSGLDI